MDEPVLQNLENAVEAVRLAPKEFAAVAQDILGLPVMEEIATVVQCIFVVCAHFISRRSWRLGETDLKGTLGCGTIVDTCVTS